MITWLRIYGEGPFIHIVREETCCHHYMGYSLSISSKGYFYAPPHRQDSTYHGLCYTSRGALAGMRNSSMGLPKRIYLTTHHTISERFHHTISECSHHTISEHSHHTISERSHHTISEHSHHTISEHSHHTISEHSHHTISEHSSHHK